MSAMNIYAMPGDKIRFCFPHNGSELNEKNGRRHLKLGWIYTIHHVESYSDHTDVFIHEVPNIRFNSVYFEDIPSEQECPDRSWSEVEALLNSVKHNVLMKQDFQPDSVIAPELMEIKRLYYEFARDYRFYVKRRRFSELARQIAINDLKSRHNELK